MLYINQIDIQNSTLIVDYQKNKYPFKRLDVNEDGFSGITDMSLEYIKIKGDHNPYLEKGTEYNKWPTLDEELKYVGQYPSKPPPRHWDDDGIYYYGKKGPEEIAYATSDELPFSDKRLCDVYEPGTRWSADKEPLQAQFWPNNYAVPRNCGENYSLFDLTEWNILRWRQEIRIRMFIHINIFYKIYLFTPIKIGQPHCGSLPFN